MGPKRRERYNAKARGSKTGASSHKGKKSMRQRQMIEADANAQVMDEATRAALVEQDRQRRQLLREGGNDDTMKISSKKRKRLDKFIEAKLRKEEKARVLEKLAKSSAEISDRTELVSAATLGTGQVTKEANRVKKILDKQHGEKKSRPAAFVIEEDNDDEDLDAMDAENNVELEREHDSQNEETRQNRIFEALKKFEAKEHGAALAKPAAAAPLELGSALAKGADQMPVKPVMRKRQRHTNVVDRSNLSITQRILRGRHETVQNDDTDSSFDSEDESESKGDSAEEAPSQNVYDVDKMMSDKKTAEKENEFVPTDESQSEESDTDTDADEEAVLLEAMRQRGMLPLDAQSIPEDMLSAMKDTARKRKGDVPSGASENSESDRESVSEGTDDQDEEETSDEDEGESDEDEDTSEEDADELEESEDEDDGGDELAMAMAMEAAQPPPSKRHGIGESVKSRGFKEWAMEALQLTRSKNDQEERPLEPVGGHVVRVRDLGPQDGRARGPLGQDLSEMRSAFTQNYFDEEALFKQEGGKAPLRHVNVDRPEALQQARMELPVVAEEDTIMRTVLENPVTVLCGETGSGKTTQVPQFLYEAGFATKGSGMYGKLLTNSANPGMIGVTQPRRVAAVSMARRVAEELQLTNHRVSHQVRYDATTSPHTQIKFMTDGVLLRELAQDLTLTKYSVIIVDEAHERSVNTDVLIGMLSRVVKLREKYWVESEKQGIDAPRPLRLVIMSATLRVSDFTRNTTLFPTPPPVVHIGARQHPVTVHFNRRTVQDYVTESIKKTSKIHTRLPQGGILVFLTGQQEVQTVCRKLAQRYGSHAVKKQAEFASKAVSARVAAPEAEEMDLGTGENAHVDHDLDDDSQDDDEALDSDDDMELAASDVPMHILPLYSLLPTAEQQRVFEEPPPNTRLVVVATNVAETSITIPNIKYVVDCGRAKERHIDPRSQVQSYDVSWISKASAAQRAGRAGRTGPGHCYRLYSSALYEELFQEFSVPEILRTPVDGLVLQMKAMNIDNVAHFPFPTPPDRQAIVRSERMLVHLGALENTEAKSGGKRVMHAAITNLGKVMALFPVAPRYAKLLAQGHQHACLPYAVAIVAAMSVGDVFEREDMLYVQSPTEDPAEAKERRRAARSAYLKALRVFDSLGDGQSDAFRLLSVVGAYSHEASHGASVTFCRDHFVRQKSMEEIHKLRAQLSNLVLANLAGLSETEMQCLQDPQLPPPTPAQMKVLRQLLASIYIDRVVVRADVVGAPEAELAPAEPGAKMASTRRVPYVALGVQGPVFIHVSSTFYHRPPPEWLVFGEAHQSAPKEASVEDEEQAPRTQWLKMVTKINPAWISTLGRTLCTFSQAADAPSSHALSQSMKALKQGERKALTRNILITPRYGGSQLDGGACGGQGWELPSFTAKQVFENGRWVTQH